MEFNKQIDNIKNTMIDYLNFIIESRNVQTLEIKNTNVYILADGTKRVDRISKNYFLDKHGYEYSFHSVTVEELADFATNIQSYL